MPANLDYPNNYKDYFRNIVLTSATAFPPGLAIKTMFYGDSWRIIEGEKSEIQYPALWVEFPEYRYYDRSDNFLKNVQVDLMVIADSSRDDYEGQNTNLDTCHRIVEQIIKRLKLDGHIKKNDAPKVEPITTALSDNNYGYRLTVEIKNLEGNFMC